MKHVCSLSFLFFLHGCQANQEAAETFSAVDYWLSDVTSMRVEDGTYEHPFYIPVDEDGRADFIHRGDTSEALSDRVDNYPPFDQNESGPEVFYVFEIEQTSQVDIWLNYPEPDGVDVDVHLLTGIEPVDALDRDHYEMTGLYKAGTYYISVDTWVNSSGQEFAGEYTLNVGIEPFFAGDMDSVIPLERDVETPVTLPLFYVDARDTSFATSDQFDEYPPFSYDESGPEYIYGFTVDEPVRFSAELLAPVPEGVDVDLHLLDELSELALVERDDAQIFAYLEPGTYYITADTYGGTLEPTS